MSDFPRPGLPSKSASRPRGRKGSHNQRILVRTCESGSEHSGDLTAPSEDKYTKIYIPKVPVQATMGKMVRSDP